MIQTFAAASGVAGCAHGAAGGAPAVPRVI
jgi:hypothetical protein